MAANASVSHDTASAALHKGAQAQQSLLQRLNRTIDRLFGFDLRADELRQLADSRETAESAKVPDVRTTLGGSR